MEPYIFPVSFAQQRLWFLDRFDPGKSVFHLLTTVRFHGPLDLAALQQALNEILRRHESLRTSFIIVNDHPMQSVARELQLELPVIDLFGLNSNEVETEARRWCQSEGERPFDLAAGPLIRANLLRLGPEENLLVVTMHHVISDGWSMGVFLRELATLYEAFRDAKPSPLPELSIQYADYAVWQREWMEGEVLESHLSYWTNHLAGAPSVLELATDWPRPAVQTFAGARLFSEIPDHLADRLRAFSRQEGVTLFMTLLAAFDVLLWRYCGQEDVVVGIPLAGRSRSELEDLIGLFVNTLPVRANLTGNPTFRELLQQVRDAALGAYSHQEIPLDRLVEEMQPARSLSHSPLFQVIFALENTQPVRDLKGITFESLEVDRGTARDDLSLFISDKGGALSAVWEYSTDLFAGETIRGFISSYNTLLESLLDRPAAKIGDLHIWSEDERRELLTKWNREQSDSAETACMHQLFEAQAELTPNAIAVVCGESRLTYAQLNTRANQVAHWLQRHGAGPETPVGVFVERSLEMIIGLLGVLKSGGAYVPFDPGYPPDRLAFMFEDSRILVLLTESDLLRTLPALQTDTGIPLLTLCLDDSAVIANEATTNPTSPVTAESLAYIIYTSGSTGRPKGVEIAHKSVIHLFAATRAKLGFKPGDIWTVVHSSAFDFSVWEIWGCLLQGGSLVIVPLEVVQSPPDFFQLLCQEQVTILNQTPSALRELLSAREHALQGNRDWNVRLIVCGGDALDSELALKLGRLDVPVWNFYGPTESSVWTTCTELAHTSETQSPRDPPVEMSVPSIGLPIPDLQVYLLDQNLQPVPPLVAGELFIGGAGLARGYLRRPGLTAEKFIPNPFSDEPGTRLYRTGDLARHRRDGRIEFIGRLDSQVKLRGFRIELGEIESALAKHPGVAQAVVILREDRPWDFRLVAYIVPHNDWDPGVLELRNHLRLALPEYMVPSTFVKLDEMPLTTNKKVDRRALPAPERTGEQVNDFVAPHTPLEELIAEIWSQVLHVSPIGLYDDFFELGGHSLLATQVTSRMRHTLKLDLPVRALFECRTVEATAARVQQMMQVEGGVQAPAMIAVGRDGKLPLSFAQQRLWFLDQLEPGNAFYNIGRALRLRGRLDVAALAASIDYIIQRHESLRTCFGEDDGTPFQWITTHPRLIFHVADLREIPEALREKELEGLAAEEIKRPFDLTRDPLLRGKLIRVEEEDHVLVVTLHHIAADEWSLAILFRELTALYDAFTRAEPSPLPELPIQYADYAVWQRRYLQGDVHKKLVSYWQNHLAGVPTLLALPTDKPRPTVQSFRGAYEVFEMPRPLLDELKQLSLKEGVTLFMTCLAAYQVLLARFTGQRDLLVGTDVANRGHVETESLIGFFTNLLPLRANLDRDLEFTTLLRHVRETTLQAYAHQELPFERMVEELRPVRDPARNPMVQVLLVMQNPQVPIELTGLAVSPYDLPLETSRFDLVLFLSEDEQGLSGFWLYNPDLFESATIVRLSDNYQALLEQIIAQPSSRLDAFKILNAESGTQRTGSEEMDKTDLKEARQSRLRNIRRRGVDLSQARGVRTGAVEAGSTLPLLIEPDGVDIDLAEWAGAQREFVNQKLLEHGALLFRGFEVASVPQFEKFAAAVCDELFGEYGDLPREEQGGKVYGSTPYPADERILFHNESSHMHRWPMLIWFYCVTPAAQGGESPIIDCRRIYQELEPKIRDRFESKGLLYVRNFTAGLDVSWQDFFHTTDRSAVEAYCRNAGIEFEWKGNDLRTRQLAPAVVKHPQTGELVFFNQLQLHHPSCLASGVRESLLAMMPEEDLPRNVYYGDGSRIEASVMESIGALYQQLGVGFPWLRHDVLMLNNMLVAHSRNPYVGERKIVVALGNLVTKSEIDAGGV